MLSNEDLIALAASVLRPREVAGRLFGDVGSALLAESQRLYTGVSVDTASWGLCAERSAMAAMITAGESRVTKIVAVWRDPQSGSLFVLPPCGLCREFLRAVAEENLSAEIILGRHQTLPLRDLLPFSSWPQTPET